MTDRVGMHLRCENIIGKVIEIKSEKEFVLENNCWFSRIATNPNQRIIDLNYEPNLIFKVANTPQDLIEVGDLIACDRYFPTPRVINEDTCKQLLSEYWKPFITKILTPNSNGGYDLQWRKENEKNIRSRVD